MQFLQSIQLPLPNITNYYVTSNVHGCVEDCIEGWGYKPNKGGGVGGAANMQDRSFIHSEKRGRKPNQ